MSSRTPATSFPTFSRRIERLAAATCKLTDSWFPPINSVYSELWFLENETRVAGVQDGVIGEARRVQTEVIYRALLAPRVVLVERPESRGIDDPAVLMHCNRFGPPQLAREQQNGVGAAVA